LLSVTNTKRRYLRLFLYLWPISVAFRTLI